MTTIPLWLVLLASVRERRPPTRMVAAGLVLGTLGVGLLAGGKGAWSGTLVDRMALVGAGLSWAAGSLIARDGSRPQSATQSTAMQLAGGGIVVLLLSGLGGELSGWDWSQITTRGSLSLAFLVLGGTVLGFGAYTWLLRVTSPAAVGTYAFVNPVVALALAWVVGDEPFSMRTVAAAAVVLAGVGLIWKSSAQTSHSNRSEESAQSRSGVHSPNLRRADPSLRSG
jgi:drug/metabolite transporter (DMT)-like permease